MKLFQSARALCSISLVLFVVIGLSACGSTGGEADTTAPMVTLVKIPVTTTVRTRLLSGTVDAGSTVEVTADPAMDPKPKISPPVVDGTDWSCSIDLVPGVNTLFVMATDATGNNLTLAFSLNYEVFTLDQVLLSTSVQGQTLSGTLADGGSFSGALTIPPSETVVQNIPSITAANWTHTLETLDPGTYTLTLKGTDDITPSSTRIQTLTQTLVIDSSLPAVTVNPALAVGATVAIDGTVATDSTISEVRLNGVVVALATVTQAAGSGTWSVTLSDLQSGRNQIDVTAARTADPEKKGTARLFVLYQP